MVKASTNPESKRYDELKGKPVVIVLSTESGQVASLRGVLRWVDRFTIGVHMEEGPVTFGTSDQVWILNKGRIVAIGEA